MTSTNTPHDLNSSTIFPSSSAGRRSVPPRSTRLLKPNIQPTSPTPFLPLSIFHRSRSTPKLTNLGILSKGSPVPTHTHEQTTTLPSYLPTSFITPDL
ncbi:hypothetical protein P691DRAFT_802809 [Macrolepiota fuliginosa MF-IS2]|uniref:Uncharacterized protein n=1 Tax=Macrolepiota fuliginosa MF-IS2 TaxID=1400762 RepID=A0A9P5XLJ2_9AGAR|nr:hypothetical protein P691DRAFT_802809 [Macrolepiota fuliginosa MF-IS2]